MIAHDDGTTGGNVTFNMPAFPAPRTGWRCPVCGAGVAPDIARCPCVATPQVIPFVHPAPWPEYPTWYPTIWCGTGVSGSNEDVQVR